MRLINRQCDALEEHRAKASGMYGVTRGPHWQLLLLLEAARQQLLAGPLVIQVQLGGRQKASSANSAWPRSMGLGGEGLINGGLMVWPWPSGGGRIDMTG